MKLCQRSLDDISILSASEYPMKNPAIPIRPPRPTHHEDVHKNTSMINSKSTLPQKTTACMNFILDVISLLRF